MKIHNSIIHGTGAMAADVTISSLTATSVTISWSPQPAQFHLPVVEYTVSLTRVTGSSQTLCTQVMDTKQAVTTTNTSMSFTGLEEFSTYTVTVTTTFNVFGSNMDVASDMMFTTTRAGNNYLMGHLHVACFLSVCDLIYHPCSPPHWSST